MNSLAIQASSLVKSFGQTTALAGVDLAIRAGEAVAVMGASGSGKTTLLHVLAGIVRPDAGRVVLHPGSATEVDVTGVRDRDLSRLRREQFGFVFQQGLLLPELTAVENVALAQMVNGMPRAESEARARECLALLGLSGMEARRIGELSGGQAQRVAIARAQVTGARVVFADEPTGALDSGTSSDVMKALLASTVDTGRTLILVTHDPSVAERCSRILHMRDGLLVGERLSTELTA
jgi:putative ABC transport system ATP-binding protein